MNPVLLTSLGQITNLCDSIMETAAVNIDTTDISKGTSKVLAPLKVKT